MAQQKKSVYGKRRKQRAAVYSVKHKGHWLFPVVFVTLLLAVALMVSSPSVGLPNKTYIDGGSLLRVHVGDTVPEQIVEYTGFVVSYNKEKHQPNYVAWELLGSETEGAVVRDNKFYVDPIVEGSARLSDYRNSGFDRGHMMPAADAKWDSAAMAQSHSLANICPQHHRLNSGAWASLEANCRQWARRDSNIVVICGPVLSDFMTDSIGEWPHKVPVPQRFFKVVLSPSANPPCGIGFIMSNAAVQGGVLPTAVTIRDVEAITGFDFFSALPHDLEEQVETQCAYHFWQRKNK